MHTIELNQFAAMNMIYNRHSFAYFLDSLERLGIRNFELWTGAPHLCHLFDSLSDARKVRREVSGRDLKIVCVTPEQVMYPYNIAASDQGLRAASLEYFYKYIDMTAELGVDKMLCCAGWGDYQDDTSEAWKHSVDGLQKMNRRAEQAGIILAFEILCPFESNLVNNLETTERMMQEITSDSFRLCVDTVPVRLGQNTLDEFFSIFGGRICHVHLTDGTPTGHVPFGTGSHPLKEHLEALSKYNYDGFITLEIGDTSWSAKPEQATRIGFESVKQLLPFKT